MYEYCETSLKRTTRSNFSVSIELGAKPSHEIQVVKNFKKTIYNLECLLV